MSRIGFIAILVVFSISIEQSLGFACTRTNIPGIYRIDPTVTAGGMLLSFIIYLYYYNVIYRCYFRNIKKVFEYMKVPLFYSA